MTSPADPVAAGDPGSTSRTPRAHPRWLAFDHGCCGRGIRPQVDWRFRADPVADELLSSLLLDASGTERRQRAAVAYLRGERASMTRMRRHLPSSRPSTSPSTRSTHPPSSSLYCTNRFRVGEAMYATVGIAREDKERRLPAVRA